MVLLYIFILTNLCINISYVLMFVNCFSYVKYNIIFVFFNLKFIIMKAIAYKRKKQFTNEVESHVGIYNKEKMNKYQNVNKTLHLELFQPYQETFLFTRMHKKTSQIIY